MARAQHTSRPTALLTIGLLLGVFGCDRAPADGRSAGPDVVASDSIVSDTATVVARRSTYDPALGALLVVPVFDGEAGADRVAILSPLLPGDTPVDDPTGLRARLGDGRVMLVSRAGEVGQRRIAWDAALTASSGTAASGASGSVPSAFADSGLAPVAGVCAVWPRGRLLASDDSTGASGASPPLGDGSLGADSAFPAWSVAFPVGLVSAVSLDSIEALPSRDSLALAVNFNRLASALVEDSASPFRGLPFTVARAYRAQGVAVPFAMAVLVRRIPQEDRPLEERLLLLATLPVTPSARWSTAWFERTSGREEEVIATEPLAVVTTSPDSPAAVILGRDDGSGTSLALLERRGTQWSIRWESPVSGC